MPVPGETCAAAEALLRPYFLGGLSLGTSSCEATSCASCATFGTVTTGGWTGGDVSSCFGFGGAGCCCVGGAGASAGFEAAGFCDLGCCAFGCWAGGGRCGR